MRRLAERLGEIEQLAAQSLKNVEARPVVASAHAAARMRLTMRRIAYLDRSFTHEALVIASEATLLYGSDRDALRRHPSGQQALKQHLSARIKALQRRAREKLALAATLSRIGGQFTQRSDPPSA